MPVANKCLRNQPGRGILQGVPAFIVLRTLLSKRSLGLGALVLKRLLLLLHRVLISLLHPLGLAVTFTEI